MEILYSLFRISTQYLSCSVCCLCFHARVICSEWYNLGRLFLHLWIFQTNIFLIQLATNLFDHLLHSPPYIHLIFRDIYKYTSLSSSSRHWVPLGNPQTAPGPLTVSLVMDLFYSMVFGPIQVPTSWQLSLWKSIRQINNNCQSVASILPLRHICISKGNFEDHKTLFQGMAFYGMNFRHLLF